MNRNQRIRDAQAKVSFNFIQACRDSGRESYRDEISDHLPFVATFRIDRDRD